MHEMQNRPGDGDSFVTYVGSPPDKKRGEPSAGNMETILTGMDLDCRGASWGTPELTRGTKEQGQQGLFFVTVK